MCVLCVSQNIKELERERETERGISGRADHNRGHQLQNAFVTADAANGRGTPGRVSPGRAAASTVEFMLRFLLE